MIFVIKKRSGEHNNSKERMCIRSIILAYVKLFKRRSSQSGRADMQLVGYVHVGY